MSCNKTSPYITHPTKKPSTQPSDIQTDPDEIYRPAKKNAAAVFSIRDYFRRMQYVNPHEPRIEINTPGANPSSRSSCHADKKVERELKKPLPVKSSRVRPKSSPAC